MGYDADIDLEMNRGMRKPPTDPAKSFIESSSLSRPGNNWVYAWRNPTGAASELPDGGLTVVVWARDRGGFDYYKDKPDECPAGTPDPRLNFGSETVAFTLDTTFNSPLSAAWRRCATRSRLRCCGAASVRPCSTLQASARTST